MSTTIFSPSPYSLIFCSGFFITSSSLLNILRNTQTPQCSTCKQYFDATYDKDLSVASQWLDSIGHCLFFKLLTRMGDWSLVLKYLYAHTRWGRTNIKKQKQKTFFQIFASPCDGDWRLKELFLFLAMVALRFNCFLLGMQ